MSQDVSRGRQETFSPTPLCHCANWGAFTKSPTSLPTDTRFCARVSVRVCVRLALLACVFHLFAKHDVRVHNRRHLPAEGVGDDLRAEIAEQRATNTHARHIVCAPMRRKIAEDRARTRTLHRVRSGQEASRTKQAIQERTRKHPPQVSATR